MSITSATVILLSYFLTLHPSDDFQTGSGKVDTFEQQSITLSLMHRRSGDTSVRYPSVQNGDTIHYYLRKHNPMFRVYNFPYWTGSAIDSIRVDVYHNQQLIDSYQPSVSVANRGFFFVETKIQEEETGEHLTLYLASESNGQQPSRFEFTILFDSRFFRE